MSHRSPESPYTLPDGVHNTLCRIDAVASYIGLAVTSTATSYYMIDIFNVEPQIQDEVVEAVGEGLPLFAAHGCVGALAAVLGGCFYKGMHATKNLR